MVQQPWAQDLRKRMANVHCFFRVNHSKLGTAPSYQKLICKTTLIYCLGRSRFLPSALTRGGPPTLEL
ncbi:unnamed protein product [Protopolystoma xenopodis]|uniref:Uncharacterized protein n=1 Tax=Protopolystoma xenopodis TaxID=117903 RepID=A0A3S5A5Z1_9PLAT|nr:unnamed protein product [Protopolystoma xenopodis]